MLSIPDWGATPFAAGREPRRIATEIDAYNAVNRAETERAGAVYVEVTELSRERGGQRGLGGRAKPRSGGGDRAATRRARRRAFRNVFENR